MPPPTQVVLHPEMLRPPSGGRFTPARGRGRAEAGSSARGLRSCRRLGLGIRRPATCPASGPRARRRFAARRVRLVPMPWTLSSPHDIAPFGAGMVSGLLLLPLFCPHCIAVTAWRIPGERLSHPTCRVLRGRAPKGGRYRQLFARWRARSRSGRSLRRQSSHENGRPLRSTTSQGPAKAPAQRDGSIRSR